MKTYVINAIVALLLIIGVGVVTPRTQQSNVQDQNVSGGLSDRDIQAISIKVGQSGAVSGTKYSYIKSGTCFLLADSSHAATTTKNFDCAVTGARSGDLVRMSLAASTTLASQYIIKSAQASTTANFLTVQLLNLTGTSAVPSATNGFGSSTSYMLFRPN